MLIKELEVEPLKLEHTKLQSRLEAASDALDQKQDIYEKVYTDVENGQLVECVRVGDVGIFLFVCACVRVCACECACVCACECGCMRGCACARKGLQQHSLTLRVTGSNTKNWSR